MGSLYHRFRAADRDLLFFLGGAALFAMCNGGIFETALNNYLVDVFDISGTRRGQVEFFRELPGFLTVILSGALFFLADTRLMSAAVALSVVGLLGIAQSGHNYSMMVGCLMVASSGLHVQMPVADSISIRLARKGRGATRMGQVGAIAAAGYIAGCGAVWVARRFDASYYDLFVMAIVVGLVSCAVYALMHPGSADPAQARPRLVVRRQYRLYYVLSTLFGARKQVFLTFAPFVLIRIYHQPVETFAKLGMVAALIGLFFRPALGRLIDRVGERTILMADAVVSLVITFSYGFADQWGLGSYTICVLYACWIVDSVTFAVGMARTTYLNRIVVERSDLTPTLSLGITINHAVSMIVPTIGGMVWDSPGLGYRIVFLGAALVAASTLAAASVMPRGGRDGGEVSVAPAAKEPLAEEAQTEQS